MLKHQLVYQRAIERAKWLEKYHIKKRYISLSSDCGLDIIENNYYILERNFLYLQVSLKSEDKFLLIIARKWHLFLGELLSRNEILIDDLPHNPNHDAESGLVFFATNYGARFLNLLQRADSSYGHNPGHEIWANLKKISFLAKKGYLEIKKAYDEINAVRSDVICV